jgi:hypothetical protein
MDKPRSFAPIIAALLLLLFFLPVLYVLSVGPAVWLVNNGSLDEDTAKAFYWPLRIAIEACSPFRDALAWYISLFDDRQIPRYGA